MEVALDMLLPVLAGMFAGLWLHENWGWNLMIVPALAILGMVGGIRIAYKRAEAMRKNKQEQAGESQTTKRPKTNNTLKTEVSPVKGIFDSLSDPDESEELDKDLY